MQELYEKYGFFEEGFDLKKLVFRMELLQEEFEETTQAVIDRNAEEVVDGLIDLIVIAIGTLELAGVNTHKAWNEVMRANFEKQRGIKPGRENSGGFDVIKPEGWKGPNHENNHGKLEEVLGTK
jgi:predicted HAD superfamily Cof-like phosphohydrolase